MKRIIEIALWSVLLSFSACQEKLDGLNLPHVDQKYVVEGYIEQGLPPVVIITESQPYLDPINAETVTASFVSGADVYVSDGSNTYKLQEYSLRFILDTLSIITGNAISVESLASQFGIVGNVDQFNPGFYTTFDFFGQLETQYDLLVNVEGYEMTATTYMPALDPVDSLWVEPHPNPEKADELVQLYVKYTDTKGVSNQIRYFTQRNFEPFYPPLFNSIFNDEDIFLLDGESITIPMERGWFRYNTEIDFDEFLYFEKGDTIRLRWCAIDRAHYDFWSTLEFARGQQGNPFGRPTNIKSNINGGLGIWGAYAASYETLLTD